MTDDYSLLNNYRFDALIQFDIKIVKKPNLYENYVLKKYLQIESFYFQTKSSPKLETILF